MKILVRNMQKQRGSTGSDLLHTTFNNGGGENSDNDDIDDNDDDDGDISVCQQSSKISLGYKCWQ